MVVGYAGLVLSSLRAEVAWTGKMEMVVVMGLGMDGWMVPGGRSRSNEKDIFEMSTVLCDLTSEINVMCYYVSKLLVEHP